MINKIEVFNIKPNIKLHMMQSRKFKTDLIGISFKRPLNDYEATMNTLITRILERGTANYPSIIEINSRLEDLYGAIIVADVTKYGEKQVIQFKCQIPNKKHIDDKEIYEKAFKLIYDIATNPSLEDGGFVKEYFDQEVENLRNEILSLKNDKGQYSVERCIEVMCEDEPYRIHQYGSVEELEKITIDSLYKHYQEILRTSQIDITTIGDLNFDEAKKIITDNAHFEVKEPVVIPDEIVYKDVEKVKVHKDYFKVNQGKISIGYRTNIKFSDPLYEACQIFSGIFGGGGNSKLFMNVREKESLCYYIYSRIDKYKGVMLVSAGVEFENFSKVETMVDENFGEVLKGNFTDSDIKIAKDGIISSINSISDYPNSFLNFYYSQSLSGDKFDMESLKDRINKVTREDIIKAGKRIQKDTVAYILSEEMEEA